ncbi:MAG: hypothetical protein WDW38_011295 [Sanguina aurantia]
MEDTSGASPQVWEALRQLQRQSLPLSVSVTSATPDEYLCIAIGKLRGIILISELRRDLRRKDARQAVGQKLELKVLQAVEEEGRLLLCGLASHALIQARLQAIETINFVPGDFVSGTVVSMTKYGVFINLCPGLDGFMHVSNMSTKLVKFVADLYTVGQQIETSVLTSSRAPSAPLQVLILEVDSDRAQVNLRARYDAQA